MDEDRILNALAEMRREQRLEMEGLRNAGAELASTLTEFRVVVMNWFERIEDRLTAMAEDISVNMMAVMHENTKRRNDRAEAAELTEMVAAMHRRMRLMQTDLDELQKRVS